MTYEALRSALQALQLDIFGAFHPCPQDAAPKGCKTLLLLGSYEPGFWAIFTASAEYNDGRPDPLDRWSKRVVTPWAQARNSAALFPSDGPPFAPFIEWAKRSGRAWSSPIGMLGHDHAGLWVSYRAAVGLPEYIQLPDTGPSPCDVCETRPCLLACPVNALSADRGYDMESCKTHLNADAGKTCMETGCLVRNACTAGCGYGRLPKQSAFHMDAFNP